MGGRFGIDLSQAWEDLRADPGHALDPDVLPYEIPARLGQYEILELIGRGGMGMVYRARHIALKSERALKVLNPGRSTDRQIGQFYREIEAVGRLQHPNIVAAHDALQEQGLHFLVMEHVEGVNLAQLISRAGPLSIGDAAEIARQAALGLGYAHKHGMIHRDVKPSNLLLSSAGVVKILDLGLVAFRVPAEANAPCAEQSLEGTPAYMAPEQWAGAANLDARADLYSLGCTLFELLVGAPLASAKEDGTREFGRLPRLRQRRPEVPRELDALLQRMLSERPEGRPSDAEEVSEALAPFCRGAALERLALPFVGTAAETMAEPGALSAPFDRGRHWRITRRSLIAGAAAAAASAGTFAWFRPRRKPEAFLLPTGKWPQWVLLEGPDKPAPPQVQHGSIAVHSAAWALLGLGVATRFPYKLTARMSVTNETRRAGLFFGYGTLHNESGAACQLVEFDHYRPNGLRVNWSELTDASLYDPPSPSVFPLAYGGESVAAGALHELEVTVEQSGVTAVSVNGQRSDLAQLSGVVRGGHGRALGIVGVFVEQGDVVIERPQLIYP
ncbi:MAG: serine/threonine-protein kinase [Pirellulales bacterium]